MTEADRADVFRGLAHPLRRKVLAMIARRERRVSDIPENDRPFGQSEEEIVKDWCGRIGIPYLGRADIGHDAQNKIVPFGAFLPA